jgi:hypothetical protein
MPFSLQDLQHDDVMRRNRVLLIVGACLLGLVGVSLWAPSSEPEYKGKTLSKLVTLGWRNGVWVGTDQEGREVIEAAKHIGTNALPWLLKWIDDENPWEIWSLHFIGKLPGPVRGVVYRRCGPTLERKLKDRKGVLAYFWIMRLGSRAAPAVPELTRRMNDASVNNYRINAAMRALSYIGKDGLPPLVEVADGSNVTKSATAFSHICDMINLGTNARPVVPKVVALLNGPDGTLAGKAANVLGCWRIEPALVVPALAESVKIPNPNMFLRVTAAEALGKFGTEAEQAVPALVEVLTDADRDLRRTGTNALLKIAPEALGMRAANSGQ